MAEATGKGPQSDEAFVAKVTACQRDLRAFILGLIPHNVDADDVLQEVNLALWRKRDSYDAGQEFARWAFGFAALEVRSFRSRSAKNRLWMAEETVELLAEDWPRSSAFREDCQDALATCLSKLSESQRYVIEAKYNSRLNAKQIASETGKPLSTVYKIMTRAMASLRACVKLAEKQSNQ